MNKRPNNKRYRQKLDVCYSFVINGQQVNFREAIPDVDIHEKVKKTIDAYYAQSKLERLKDWNERREYFNRNKRGIEELERKAPKQAMTVPSYNPPNNKTSPGGENQHKKSLADPMEQRTLAFSAEQFRFIKKTLVFSGKFV